MDEFCAITGLDEDSSAIYMEMGGYDLDTALQLFFSMNDGDTGGGNPAPTSGGGWPHEWMGFLFPSPSLSGSHSVPDAWLQQGLQTIPTPTTDWSALNILQHKNGPCGVLAAFQGYLITHLLDDHTLSPTYQPTIRDTIAAVTRLLHTVAPPSPGSVVPLKICCWQDPINGVGGAVVISEDADGVFLSKVIDQYLAPGGVLLLLCSALHTFGADVLQQQHSALLPLLSGQHALCSSALMNILLTGEANETLGAYNDCGARIPWNKPKASVGLLSGTEIELKMKIHDGFKCPAHEVYVLHGRDHFTTLLVIPLQTSSQASKEPQASSWAITMPPPVPHEESSFMCATTPSTFTEALSFSLVHFNGLPPAGPAVSLVGGQGLCCSRFGACLRHTSRVTVNTHMRLSFMNCSHPFWRHHADECGGCARGESSEPTLSQPRNPLRISPHCQHY